MNMRDALKAEYKEKSTGRRWHWIRIEWLKDVLKTQNGPIVGEIPTARNHEEKNHRVAINIQYINKV